MPNFDKFEGNLTIKPGRKNKNVTWLLSYWYGKCSLRMRRDSRLYHVKGWCCRFGSKRGNRKFENILRKFREICELVCGYSIQGSQKQSYSKQ